MSSAVYQSKQVDVDKWTTLSVRVYETERPRKRTYNQPAITNGQSPSRSLIEIETLVAEIVQRGTISRIIIYVAIIIIIKTIQIKRARMDKRTWYAPNVFMCLFPFDSTISAYVYRYEGSRSSSCICLLCFLLLSRCWL